MKCANCKREMREGLEQVGIGANNQPIVHKFGYCDYCKIKTDIDLVNSYQEPKKKDSVLSIIAVILALFTCTAVFGGIIGVIDLIINDKTKRHLGSWFAIIFSVIATFLGVALCFSPTDNKDDDTVKITDSNANKENPNTSTENTNVQTNKVNIDNCDIEYLRYDIKKDDDTSELLVYFKFTNNSDENKAWWLTTECKAFQNGIELDTDYWHDTDESKNADKEIQPGYSIEVCEEFLLDSTSSNVTVQISKLYSFNDKIDMELNIDLSK